MSDKQILYIPPDGKLYEEPGWFAAGFAQSDLTLIRGDRFGSEAKNAALGPDAEVVIVGSGRYPVTAITLDVVRSCRLAVRMGAGYDTIDVAEATRRGVMVANLPGATAEEVSDHTVALYLASLRRLAQHTQSMRAGRWDPVVAKGTPRLRGQTMGLVGFGRIARNVARKISAFSVKCITYDPYVRPEAAAAAGVEWVGFDELLQRADVVSVHAPANAETKALFDAAAFAKMKPGAIFINTSRGPLVDEKALFVALREGHLQAAALDVFQPEPPLPDNPLLQLDNIILTPHIASFSTAGLHDFWQVCYDVVTDFLLRGRVPESVVNPEVLKK